MSVGKYLPLGLGIALTASACQLPTPHYSLTLDRGSGIAGPTSSAQVNTLVPTGVLGPNRATGELTVALADVFRSSGQHVLAVLADVDHVSIEITDVGGVKQTQALSKGTLTCTFTGVGAGAVIVKISVFDVANNQIGFDQESAVVTAGQTTAIAPNVQLDPNWNVPTPLPTGAVAGGGGTPQSLGALSIGLTLLPGQEAHPLTRVATVQVAGGVPLDDYKLDAKGNFWAVDGIITGNLVTFSPSGQLIASRPPSAWAAPFMGVTGALTFDALGNTWVNGDRIDPVNETVSRFEAPLVNTARITFLQEATDSKGNSWASIAETPFTVGSSGASTYHVYEISPSGQLLLTLPMSDQGGDIVVDSKDRVYVANGATIVQLAADGTTTHVFKNDQLLSFGMTGSWDNMGVDSKDNLWVLNYDGLNIVKLSPDGSELGIYPVPGHGSSLGGANATSLFVDAKDRVWVNNFGTKGLQVFGNDGSVVALYSLPDPSWSFDPLLVDQAGGAWVRASGGWGRFVP